MSGAADTSRVTGSRVGRNDPCACGSGRKYKHCCQAKESAPASPGGANARPPQATKQRLKELFHAAKGHWGAGRLPEAIPLLREIARLDPNAPQAHHDLGVTYLRCGRLRDGTDSLQRAIDLRPSFEGALRHLVDGLEPQGREAEALIACRKLSRTAEDPLDRRYYAAKVLVKEKKFDEAAKELRQLVVLSPDRTEVRLLLGQLLSDQGQFEEAVNQFSGVVLRAPSALQRLAEAKRMTDKDRPLIDRLRAVSVQPGLDVMPQSSLQFGLGKAYDDLGDHAEAMRHYDQANRIRAASQRLDRETLAKTYDSHIRSFTAEGLARAAQQLSRPPVAGDDLPVFIVGLPRSGTTLAEQILSSHRDIAAGGELPFWRERVAAWRSSRIGSIDRSAVSQAADAYRALLRSLGPASRRVTDKSPSNYELLWLIRPSFPEARIIHCRRDPIDTALSIYFTNFWSRHDYAWDRSDIVFQFRQYQRLMDHWRRVLPPDRFTEVHYEALVADRETETRRLIAFLGLEWDEACLAPERNTRVVQTASVWQARQPVYKTSVERWRRYEPWLGELRELLSEGKAATS
jgi:tetratricopeptide (TPR) repeat protein